MPTAPEARERVGAVLLCGGAGTRLRPLTETVPKPLLPVGGRPLLEWGIERLRVAGITTIALATGYRAELIEAHCGDGAEFGVTLRYMREPAPLGTAGALAGLREQLGDPFVLMNGDVFTRLPLRRMLDAHRARAADLTVAVVPYCSEIPYGIIEERDGRVVAIREKPLFEARINAGIYVGGQAVLQVLPPPGTYFDCAQLITACVGAGLHVRAFPVEEYWIDIGSPEAYERLNQELPAGLDPAPREAV